MPQTDHAGPGASTRATLGPMRFIALVLLIVASSCNASPPRDAGPAATAAAVPETIRPRICNDICNQSINCNTPFGQTCKFCSFGNCSITRPEIALQTLQWMRGLIAAQPAGPERDVAMGLVDGLMVKQQASMAADAEAGSSAPPPR